MSLATTSLARQSGRRLDAVPATGVLLYRNYLAYKGAWYLFATGFLEPVFYLFSIGIGVGKLVHGFEFHGQTVGYADFVAPGMMAAAAMNGAMMDGTFNFFFKLKYNKLFDSILATPMNTMDVARGELSWCLIRGGMYSAGFLVVMLALGLVHSWWAVFAVPATLLLALAFAGVCMALTTYMRSWQDFEFVTLAIMPMFLFSATFFPVTALPGAVRWIVEITPLYRGVVLVRELVTGVPGIESVVSVVYLVAMGLAGLLVARRRLDKLLLK
ncbi:MAG: ABC transporter permease [Nocardioidaceae bacterium]